MSNYDNRGFNDWEADLERDERAMTPEKMREEIIEHIAGLADEKRREVISLAFEVMTDEEIDYIYGKIDWTIK